MRRVAWAGALLALGLAARASEAVPVAGRAVPSFEVRDLEGTRHSQRDLTGHWTVVLAMTDKDIGPSVAAWSQRITPRAPGGTCVVTFAALDLFALIPSSTIVSQAREETPRRLWAEVWFSRDGSLARSLGLPSSEEPYVLVVSPAGVVMAVEHGVVNEAALGRVLRALGGP